MCSLAQDFICVILDEASKDPFPIFSGGWDLGVEAIILQVSLNILTSIIHWSSSKMLFDLRNFNRSEDLALGLENKEVSLLLDIENIVLEQEITFSMFSHSFDQTKGLVKIIILIEGLQELRERVSRGSGSQSFNGYRASDFLKGVFADLVLVVWLTVGK